MEAVAIANIGLDTRRPDYQALKTRTHEEWVKISSK